MLTYKFDAAWIKQRWMAPCFISINQEGTITRIDTKAKAGDINITQQSGALIPGFVNAHSHSFQYAMAGCAEQMGIKSQSFWDWRHLMYKLANTLNPDDIYAIAKLLFSNLLSHGYTHVVEFLYIHKNPSGLWYDNKTEIGDAIAKAAIELGIRLTLVPVYYHQGGFNQKIKSEQKRFYIKNVTSYQKLIETYLKAYRDHPTVSIGHGLHSLRAADENETKSLIESANTLDIPFHMHISEQLKEVEECLYYLKNRPIEWLLKHCQIDEKFNLVHATHINETELNGILRANANIIICPSTEANLGDGIFPFAEFVNNSGSWTIGTDSHVGLNPFEELRWLDYGARLTHKLRKNWVTNQTNERGDYLIERAISTGNLSAGQRNFGINLNQSLDAILIDTDKDIFLGKEIDKIQSILCYSGHKEHIKTTYVNGKKVYDRDRPTNKSIDLKFTLKSILAT